MIRVLVVDDHAVVREGLELLLGRFAGIECVGTAADGVEADELLMVEGAEGGAEMVPGRGQGRVLGGTGVGEALGLPASLVWRQPFPGPGLAVRCLGDVTQVRLDRLRAADAILTTELASAGLLRMGHEGDRLSGTAQAFAVLLPVRSVGVMGDQRTYQEAVALRAVTTEDFMTADWARLPDDLLARVANRIVNEVDGINRVVYDITSKPPGTIEWE